MNRVKAFQKEARKASSTRSSKHSSAPLSRPHSRHSSAASSRNHTVSASEEDDFPDGESWPEEGESSEEDDEGFSPGSGGPALLDGTNWEERLNQALEDLGEKRTTVREEALSQLTTVLCRRYTASVLESQQETVVDSLKRCIQKGKTQKEGVEAAKALSVVYITLGPDLGMYDDLSLPLKYQISHAKRPGLQRALITALSMMCYVAGEGSVETQDLLGFLMGLAQGGSRALDPSVLTTILTSWGFLLTSLEGEGGSLRDVSWVEGSLEAHRAWLEHPSTEVRIAAGENIALILEMATMIEEEDEEGDEAGVERWARGLDVIQDILPILHTLTRESAKHRSKKERSMQKSAFREVLEMVEEGQAPTDRTITFHGTVYPVDTWIKGKRLQVFRSALGEGLTVHVGENELLLDMLGLAGQGEGSLPLGNVSGISGDDGNGREGQHQRVIHAPGSEVSKARSRNRRKDRHIRGAKLGLGDVDGEDAE
ncbi:interferon-related developmental regulator-domain-containing protein [Piptocephalis cylindrospora]|uniref:Interferon-related developmental regulator-domain-containing protein n=1 Tax=Piptocephalis cylindrospora TaxID=1907219 RepID=A0A4P9Y625_9FUNG|nr:interferon-related developmental regulator-domain-containing protein [Piptocephalis cylindrospora]|eukprot:RKP14516.1 interferon-related developmental regulator-domain-containing protein [Piptocephalis cylindrospora]